MQSSSRFSNISDVRTLHLHRLHLPQRAFLEGAWAVMEGEVEEVEESD